MKRIFKWIGWTLGAVADLLVLALLGVYLLSGQRLHKTYEVQPAAVTIPTGAAAVSEGQRQFFTHGCIDCHDTDGAGKVVIDDFLLGQITGPNLC